MGEVTTNFKKKASINFLIKSLESKYFPILGFFAIVLILGYISIVCYFGIFYLRIFGFYGFWKKHTDGETMLNSGLILTIMTPSLCYNFLFLIFGANDELKKLSFYKVKIFLIYLKVMGDLNSASILGYDVPKYLPLVLLLMLFLNLFNLYKRILRLFGWEVFDFNNKETLKNRCHITQRGENLVRSSIEEVYAKIKIEMDDEKIVKFIVILV